MAKQNNKIQEQNSDRVDVPSVAYDEMKPCWDMVDALMGGTKAMRAAGSEYLPQEGKESTSAYNNRLARSFLYAGYSDTVEKLGAKPFAKPVSIRGEIPTELEDLSTDTDRTGRDITQFARECFTSAINYGMTHILVDYPTVDPTATLADEREAGARPILVHIKPPNLIAWKSETLPNGTEELSEIRIKEIRVIPVGTWLDQQVNFIRVYTRTTWQLWQQGKDEKDEKKYVLVGEGNHTFGAVPLVTMYLNRTGFMMAEPPLEDLAWLNIAHWQSMSDQRNILRFARVGILFSSGFTEEEIQKGITVGPSRLISSANPNAKLQYVEHTGSSINAGNDDLKALEARMEVMGLQPLIAKSGNNTATGKAIDESKAHSNVQAWVRSLEDSLVLAFEVAAQWLQLKLPEDFDVDVYSAFALSLRTGQDLADLLATRIAGQIDHETYLNEIKRRGLLAENTDIQHILETIKTEGPPLGTLGLGGGGGAGGGALDAGGVNAN